MTAWSHLPNAEHIDRVLADLKANPENWSAAWGAAWSAALDAARSASWSAALDASRGTAWNAAWDAAWDAALNAVWDAVWDAARDAARAAILALIAWDTSSDLLNAAADDVRLLADLGDNRAILMLPAVIAFEKRAITA